MKVYLVEVFNSNYDYSRIEKVFTTYRGASQYLIDDGFEPYAEEWFGELKLYFCHKDESWNDEDARIIEMEIEER